MSAWVVGAQVSLRVLRRMHVAILKGKHAQHAHEVGHGLGKK